MLNTHYSKILASATLISLLFTACGDDSSSATDPEKNNTVSIENKSISGFSQKGPFITGSEVALYELDENFKQKGSSYSGKISTDDGAFKIPSISLGSQYAFLKASGYYRNEVTGKKSSGTIVLNAITDLSDRENVNVNLLTHLEYDRAMNLIEQDSSVASAKAQAEKEIFAAFGIEGKFENSEDLNILNSGDGNAALLAISILMQGNRTEAELTEFLTKFAADIEKDGKWDDESSKMNLASWAIESEKKFTTIRKQIEAWKIGEVPAFEKYITSFWHNIYKLDECTEENAGRIVDAKKLKTTESINAVICKDKSWTKATPAELKFGPCTKDVENGDHERVQKLGNDRESTDDYYVCKDGEWINDTYLADVSYMEPGKDGDIDYGFATKKMYVYDENLGGWREADEVESYGMQACTKNFVKVVVNMGSKFYICKDMGYNDYQFKLAQDEEADIYYHTNPDYKKCEEEDIGKVITGAINGKNKYYCSSNGWISMSVGWNWDVSLEARMPEISYGELKDTRDNQTYKTIKIGSQTWMAQNLNFNYNKGTAQSSCYDGKEDYCKVTGRYYTWAAAIDSVALATDTKDPQTCGYNVKCTKTEEKNLATAPIQGVCPKDWHLPSSTEWETLFEYVGNEYGKTEVSNVLKTTTGWFDDNGNNRTGLSVLPSGFIDENKESAGAGSFADFWTSSNGIGGPTSAYSAGPASVNKDDPSSKGSGQKTRFHPVRCVKN